MSHEEKPKQYFLNRYTCEFHIGRLSDDDIHVIEYSAYQALLEIIKTKREALELLFNNYENHEANPYCDLGVNSEILIKAREALSKTDDALKGLGL